MLSYSLTFMVYRKPKIFITHPPDNNESFSTYVWYHIWYHPANIFTFVSILPTNHSCDSVLSF